MTLWRHSETISAVFNNHYLDFVQTRGLISLVNENHVDNNLKEILVYVYSGWIVNNRPKKVPYLATALYNITKNKPIQIYWKFYHQKTKIFR